MKGFAIIEAVGTEITDLVVGDEVFGFVPMMPPFSGRAPRSGAAAVSEAERPRCTRREPRIESGIPLTLPPTVALASSPGLTSAPGAALGLVDHADAHA
jgi:hypothetical protein